MEKGFGEGVSPVGESTVSSGATNVEKEAKGIFETESHRKRTIALWVLGILAAFLVVGYGVTKAGHGPVAGVEGRHRVCTIQDMSLSYEEESGSEQHLGDDQAKSVTVKTRDCGVLTIDKDHVSNIDSVLSLYQNLDNGKTYEFVIRDDKYINHVNLSM